MPCSLVKHHGRCRLCCACLLQVCAVLLYAQQNNVEPFLEPVLQLADAMMARDASDMAAGASSGQLLHCFLGQLLCFMDLCTHPDAAVAVAASQCLSQLVRVQLAAAWEGRDVCDAWGVWWPRQTSSLLSRHLGAALLPVGMALAAGSHYPRVRPDSRAL